MYDYVIKGIENIVNLTLYAAIMIAFSFIINNGIKLGKKDE